MKTTKGLPSSCRLSSWFWVMPGPSAEVGREAPPPTHPWAQAELQEWWTTSSAASHPSFSNRPWVLAAFRLALVSSGLPEVAVA
jgi:hypothetical protein